MAGILLKLGGYGLLKVFRYLGDCFNFLNNFLLSINFWGVFVIRLVCFRQVDIKRLIAYSSVIHMGLIVVGVLSYRVLGWLGAMVMMLAHGVSSPGIFALARFNYDITGRRILLLQKGLINLYPVSALVWFLLLAANMAAPPSFNLGGELLICMGALKLGFFMFFILGLGTFFAAVYNLYVYARQQGCVNSFILEGGGMSSNMIMVGLAHVVPVYFLTLCVSLIHL